MQISKKLIPFSLLVMFVALVSPLPKCVAQVAPVVDERATYIRSHYAKYEFQIPMRDGTRLFTCVYRPYQTSSNEKLPIILFRTPYSVGPYGADQYKTALGPSFEFEKSGYIFAFQDVRGKYMSEGSYVNMRPHLEGKSGNQFDESSDTFDTLEWLVKNVPDNNGRVGQWGISYPGFYTAAGAIDSHPALKAISPQAPIADWFWDDMHRNGAFNLQMAFTFFSTFGKSRPDPTVRREEDFEFGTKDAYQFFLDLGPLKNVDEKHFRGEVAFWNEIQQHPNYDEFWQSRNLLPHLKNVRCASLIVGGLFDTEDLYGPLKIYKAIEKANPQTSNRLVMGPWYHGGWNRVPGDQLGEARFDWATAQWYRENVEFPFFEFHLKDKGAPQIAEATVFETGSNRWRNFESWPPAQSQEQSLYFAADGKLSWNRPTAKNNVTKDSTAADRFWSDPNKPVPYTMEISNRWSKDYMAEDQRFAARRPDVLVYRSEVLSEDTILAGPLTADIWFSTEQSDADIVVKLIDEFPGELQNGAREPDAKFQSGRQQLVRGQVMRGRFRRSFEKPVAFEPNRPEQVTFEIDDVMHNFKKGHRIMIQVQSSWFPFVDRNPQKYVPNIFDAEQADFVAAWHSVFRNAEMPSHVKVRVLKQAW